MTERPGALSGIGKTPIVRLSSLPGPDAGEVWVKLEAANPTGSYKDRMALAMIEAAEQRGELRPGQTGVEALPNAGFGDSKTAEKAPPGRSCPSRH